MLIKIERVVLRAIMAEHTNLWAEAVPYEILRLKIQAVADKIVAALAQAPDESDIEINL